MTSERDGATVAVAVVSYGTRELLDRCLAALRADHDAGLAEVHVVDNGSTDGSREFVREAHPWATLHAPDANLGYGPAVEVVAHATRTPWLVAANADTAPAPGALRALVDAGGARPRVGAVAPRLVLPDGTTQHAAYAFPTLPFTLAFNLGLPRAVPGLGDRMCLHGAWDGHRARDVPWAVAAFLLLRRRAYEEAGGFDPAQWMYAEDLELGWRLRDHGWSTWYEPTAVVHHAESAATSAAWGDTRVERWNAATYDLLRRRRGRARAAATAAVNATGAAARAAWMTPLARRRPDPWAFRRADARRWAALHAREISSRR